MWQLLVNSVKWSEAGSAGVRTVVLIDEGFSELIKWNFPTSAYSSLTEGGNDEVQVLPLSADRSIIDSVAFCRPRRIMVLTSTILQPVTNILKDIAIACLRHSTSDSNRGLLGQVQYKERLEFMVLTSMSRAASVSIASVEASTTTNSAINDSSSRTGNHHQQQLHQGIGLAMGAGLSGGSPPDPYVALQEHLYPAAATVGYLPLHIIHLLAPSPSMVEKVRHLVSGIVCVCFSHSHSHSLGEVLFELQAVYRVSKDEAHSTVM